jgi:hypothetical protein
MRVYALVAETAEKAVEDAAAECLRRYPEAEEWAEESVGVSEVPDGLVVQTGRFVRINGVSSC